jgi:hypothetical protein
MRLMALLFTALLAVSPARAQQAQPSSAVESSSPARDGTEAQASGLPVSLEKIKEALRQPAPLLSLRTIDERPTFRIQILERMKIEELLATLNFKTGPAPAGGLYGYEQQRQMFPAVDNPLTQPYAAFNQGELLSILIENLAWHYLGGRALNAVSKAERAHAESAAREEVKRTIAEYCAAQPNAGAGIQICDANLSAVR